MLACRICHCMPTCNTLLLLRCRGCRCIESTRRHCLKWIWHSGQRRPVLSSCAFSVRHIQHSMLHRHLLPFTSTVTFSLSLARALSLSLSLRSTARRYSHARGCTITRAYMVVCHRLVLQETHGTVWDCGIILGAYLGTAHAAALLQEAADTNENKVGIDLGCVTAVPLAQHVHAHRKLCVLLTTPSPCRAVYLLAPSLSLSLPLPLCPCLCFSLCICLFLCHRLSLAVSHISFYPSALSTACRCGTGVLGLALARACHHVNLDAVILSDVGARYREPTPYL